MDPWSTFSGVYDSELSYVLRTLRRLGVPTRDQEDVAHEVFVVVYRRLEDYDPARPIRPWLFGIAFRVASQYRRRASQKRERLFDAPEPHVPPKAERHMEEVEARSLVRRALESVALDRRAVLVLHDLDDVPVTLIAQELDIPLNTAYSRLRLARKELTAAVRRLQAQGGGS